MNFQSLYGFETEYGITVEGADATALMGASREVVKAYSSLGKAVVTRWNYRSEDSRNDQRGFRVEKLSVDPVDAQFDRPGERAHSPQSDRCDHLLANGARFYNDHGHPEYSTPECSDLRTLVAHDKAGERIALQCAKVYEARIGKTVEIWKNNTDFHGASYGSHESYLVRRDIEWGAFVEGLAPFFATRILFCGAGKVGCEERGHDCRYQLSQRADFFSTLQSVDTLNNRPLVNTRDEPHGDARRFRRLHVIAGDANMSEWAIALRAGTTNLVAALIESGWKLGFELRDPVRAIKQVSRDETYKWLVDTSSGSMSAVHVQRAYLEAARALELPGSEWVLGEWSDALDDLERDPMALFDRADWVAKKLLLDQFAESEDLDWTRDKLSLQSLDLAYCNVDPDAGLHQALVEDGSMRTLVTDEEIEAARDTAPRNTRAGVRGALISKFAPQIQQLSWGALETKSETRLALPETGDFPVILGQIEAANDLEELAGKWDE